MNKSDRIEPAGLASTVSRIMAHNRAITGEESTEFNKMLDSLFCECGGKYEHVDCQENDDEATVEDSYQCNQCETWCIVVWHRETEEEIEKRYELP